MRLDHRSRGLRTAFSAVVCATVIACHGLASPAAADEDVTYGDVVAHFQASEGAGSLIDLLAGPPAAEVAGPAAFFEHGIRPFPGSPWDGSSVCEEDWQLLVFALIVAALEDEPAVSRTIGVRILEPLTVELYLDGVRLSDTERTPIKRLMSSIALFDGQVVEVHDGWWTQTGVFRAPGELAVGTHAFSVVVIDPEFGEFPLDPITFEVDASGTGSCL